MAESPSLAEVLLVYGEMALIAFGAWLVLYVVGRSWTGQGPER